MSKETAERAGLIWTCKTSLKVWFEMHGHAPEGEKLEGKRVYYGFSITERQAADLEESFSKSRVGEYERRRRRSVERLLDRNRGRSQRGSPS